VKNLHILIYNLEKMIIYSYYIIFIKLFTVSMPRSERICPVCGSRVIRMATFACMDINFFSASEVFPWIKLTDIGT
jgi:hypothetical protein